MSQRGFSKSEIAELSRPRIRPVGVRPGQSRVPSDRTLVPAVRVHYGHVFRETHKVMAAGHPRLAFELDTLADSLNNDERYRPSEFRRLLTSLQEEDE